MGGIVITNIPNFFFFFFLQKVEVTSCQFKTHKK